MSQYTSNFKGELIGKNKWRNLESFEYHVGKYPSDEIITVPKGFITDFASVPRIFWPIISPIDSHGKAAVVHDYCYRYAVYDRKKSDEIFEEGLRVLKVSSWKVWCMRKSVILCGWYGWKKNRRREKRSACK